jgi:hypothetical protein
MRTVIRRARWPPTSMTKDWSGASAKDRVDFQGISSGVRWGGNQEGALVHQRGSEGPRRHRRTVGRAIPWRVASPQSPPPFHSAARR